MYVKHFVIQLNYMHVKQVMQAAKTLARTGQFWMQLRLCPLLFNLMACSLVDTHRAFPHLCLLGGFFNKNN